MPAAQGVGEEGGGWGSGAPEFESLGYEDTNPLHRSNYEQQKLLRNQASSSSASYYEEQEYDTSAADAQLPLHSAAYYGKFSALSELLDRSPAEVSLRDSNGNSVIHYCCEGGDRSLACLALLLNTRGIDINARNVQGGTALHAAARRGHDNSMQSLLISGCRRDIQDADGNTALHLAAIFGHKACAEAMLHNGADPSVRNNEGMTAADIQADQAGCAPQDGAECCLIM